MGANPRGQASSSTLASRFADAAMANSDCLSPVKLIRGTPFRFNTGSRDNISEVVPELEMAGELRRLRLSCRYRHDLPRRDAHTSQWCLCWPGVAAIFLPIWPDLPMPITTTRPLLARMISQAFTKPASTRLSNSATARFSISIVRSALDMRDEWVFIVHRSYLTRGRQTTSGRRSVKADTALRQTIRGRWI